MLPEELRLSYPWFTNQYTLVLSFLVFLLTVLYVVYLSYSQEDWRWMLLALPGLTALPTTIFDYYWCVYKAPRLIEIKDDTVDIEMRTNECFTISLFDIDRLEYIKRFLDWSPFNIKIVSSSIEHEWLLSSQYMRNVDALILMLRDKNPNCKIDQVLLEAIAKKSTASRRKS